MPEGKIRSERLKGELIELVGNEEFEKLPKYEEMSFVEIKKHAERQQKYMYELAETTPRFYKPEEIKRDITKFNYILALMDEKEMKKSSGSVSTTIPMSAKEVDEARRFGIPEQIIGKMVQGLELSEREKDIVRDHGKVYVRAFKKHEGKTVIKPQIRNIPGSGTHKKVKGHTVHIHPMMGGYYFVIRDKNYKMLYSSPIYKTRSEAKRKSEEYIRKIR